MRNPLSPKLWAGPLALVAFVTGCGKTTEAPFTVLQRSADAKVAPSEIGGSEVTVKMNATALDREQNYRFKLKLEVGGSAELRMRAKEDLSGGVVLKFARTAKGVTMHVNGDDLTADVAKVLGDGSSEINADFDIHQHEDVTHGIYSVNGKEAATGNFPVVQLQGNWGFVVKRATVREFAVGPAKHDH